MNRPGIAGLLVFALGGCGADIAPSLDFVARDSSGVRIVEYSRTPTSSASLVLSPPPLYRHGVSGDDYLFQGIQAGALLPDGGAVIADGSDQEVVWIAPDGTSYSVLARSGQGPGEVRRVLSLFTIGQDSVLVEDDGNARFTLLANGGVARTVSIAGDPTLVLGLRVLGVGSNRELLMATSSHRSGFEVDWLPGYMVRFDLDAGVADTVGSYDRVPFSPPEGPENPFLPFGQLTATGGLFVYGRSDLPELAWHGPDGELRQVVRWSAERTYPTDEHLERYRAGLRPMLTQANPRLAGTELQRFLARVLSEYELAPDEPLPLFGALHGDDEGRVWLSEYAIQPGLNGVPHYTVLAPDGEWLGVLDVPARFRLLDVAGGLVLGVVRDDMDVESIAVYKLLVR